MMTTAVSRYKVDREEDYVNCVMQKPISMTLSIDSASCYYSVLDEVNCGLVRSEMVRYTM